MTLHTSPPQTSLSLLIDNRTSVNLEIVVPVRNEKSRILPFINYYKQFDLVFLDGGSDDDTIELIATSGHSAYRRQGLDFAGENHYVLYHNFLSKSRITFYMMIDEYVSVSDMHAVASHLMMSNAIVLIDKLEFLYGHQMSYPLRFSSAGMIRGAGSPLLVYDDNSLHDSLHVAPFNLDEISELRIQLLHLHSSSVFNEYGKYGSYSSTQIRQVLASPRPFCKWSKHFFSPLASELIFKFWIRKAPLSVRSFFLLHLLVLFFLSLMVLIEQLFSLREYQNSLYSRFFNDSP